jgi:hypothetical protein
MALAGRRWRWRQVKAVRTWMAFGQEAVVRISALLQLGVTQVHLDYLAELPVPS